MNENENISVDLLEKQLMKKLAQDVGIVSEIVEFWGEQLFNDACKKLQIDYLVVSDPKDE